MLINQKPTLFIPIEIKNRELLGAMFLALHAIRLGCRVYVGTHAAIHRALEVKKDLGGIYFDKSTQPQDLLRAIREKCDRVCILDIELTPSLTTKAMETFLPQRIYSGSLSLIDRFYVCGDIAERKAKETIDKFKVRNLGWPKWDIYRFVLSGALQAKFYKDYKNKARAGDYLVFTPSFRYLKDPKIMENFRKPGIIQPSERTSLSYKQQRYLRFRRCVELLNFISKDNNCPTIVVKPHHGESSKDWRKALGRNTKIKVVSNNQDLDELIFSSVGLVHAGSTSAIHAWLLKKPVFLFKEVSDPEASGVLSKISKYVITKDTKFSLQSGESLGAKLNDEFAPDSFMDNITLPKEGSTSAVALDLLTLRSNPVPPISKVKFLSGYLTARAIKRLLGLIRDEILWLSKRTNVYPQSHAIGTGIRSRQLKSIVYFFLRSLPADVSENSVRIRTVGLNLIEFENQP